MAYKHSIKQVSLQLRDQLLSDKRKLGFFFGAGTSMSVGIPGVFALTDLISKNLIEPYKTEFSNLEAVAKSKNVEQILNKLRTVRELIGESEDQEILNIKGQKTAAKLDVEICKTISKIVSNTDISKIAPHLILSNWLFQNQGTRYSPIEIYTTNYDLIIEQALEYKKLPYFDGFVGSINPFLIPEGIEAENIKNDQSSYIPYSWIRLWKLHGSINWFLIKDKEGNKRIVRCTNRELAEGDELMIYPSKQKYDESRRLPFLVFQDRMRKFLSNGETLLIVIGYSFGDDHLNEALFQALRANKRLAITALMYGDVVPGSTKRTTNEKVLKFGLDNPNFTIIGPDKGCIGGVITEWNQTEADLSTLECWDDTAKNLNLGDFSAFTNFLKMNFGIVGQMQDANKEDSTNEE